MTTPSESKTRTLLALSATGALIGIAFCAGGNQSVGSWITVLSLLSLIWSIHRFGRTGPDEPVALGRSARPGAETNGHSAETG